MPVFCFRSIEVRGVIITCRLDLAVAVVVLAAAAAALAVVQPCAWTKMPEAGDTMRQCNTQANV